MKYITKVYDQKEITHIRVVFPRDKHNKYAKRFKVKNKNIDQTLSEAKTYLQTIKKDLIKDKIIHINSNTAKRRFEPLKNKLKKLPLNIFYHKINHTFYTTYRANKQTYTKSFSINKYGEDKALQLAIKALKEIKISLGDA